MVAAALSIFVLAPSLGTGHRIINDLHLFVTSLHFLSSDVDLLAVPLQPNHPGGVGFRGELTWKTPYGFSHGLRKFERIELLATEILKISAPR